MRIHWVHRGLFVVIAVLLLAFVACSSSDDKEESAGAAPVSQQPVVSSTAAPAPTAAPVQNTPTPTPKEPAVKRLVMSIPIPALESNQVRMLSHTDTWQLRPMYEYLIAVDNKTGQLVPGLATEWSVEDGGLSLRFKLRRGVRFHDDFGEFTAKDLVHSLGDLNKGDTTLAMVATIERGFDRIEIVNDYEVVYRLTGEEAGMLDTISEQQGNFEILSKAQFDAIGDPDLTNKPTAGTGSYQFVERTPNSKIVFKRVPYEHWKQQPAFEEFEFRFMNEASTRLAALLTDEVHITTLPDDLIKQAQNEGFQVAIGSVPALRTYFSIYCCYLDKDTGQAIHPDSPLMDVRVRRALDKAIDREELNQAFFSGEGKIMYGYAHIPEVSPDFNPEWITRFPEEYGFDPEAAKALLAEAGFGPDNPFKTSIRPTALSQISGAEDLADVVAGYWNSIGVDVNLLSMDRASWSAFRRACEADNHFALSATSSTPFIGQGFYSSSFLARCSGGFRDAEFDVAFGKIRGELDSTKHGPLWTAVGNIGFDLHHVVPLFWLPAKAVYNPEIVADYVWPGSISGTWTHINTGVSAR